mgnify:FL=1
MKFRELCRVLSDFGIQWDERKGKGSHGAFKGLTRVSKTRAVFTIPHGQQKETDRPYIVAIRRRFELTKENGVPDDVFR